MANAQNVNLLEQLLNDSENDLINIKIANKDNFHLARSIIEDIKILKSYGLKIRNYNKIIEYGLYFENKLTIVEKPSFLYLYNLFELLRLGLQNGFIITSIKDCPCRHIYLNGDKIQIYSGQSFYLASIDPFTLVETFFLNIHYMSIYKEMTVLDIGAEAGDSSIFFASKGARVYAVEPVRKNYLALLKNLTLNKDLSNNITPINVAHGENNTVTIYSDPMRIDGTASVFSNSNTKIKEKVEGLSIKSILKKLDMCDVDLLKLDSKGGEFSVSASDLKCVNKYVKIEYMITRDNEKIDVILQNMAEAGFDWFILNHNPWNKSLKTHGTIYGIRHI